MALGDNAVTENLEEIAEVTDTIISASHLLCRRKTVNKDKKLRLLLMPLIFIILLFVLVGILEIAGENLNAYIQKMPGVIGGTIGLICIIMVCVSMLIGGVLYFYVPIGVYIAMLVVYTGVCWTWILKQKKANMMYAVVWFVFCVFSVLMYWKRGLLHAS